MDAATGAGALESPLDVLSRAATMVRSASPQPGQGSPSPAPPPAADDHHLQLQHLHQPLPLSPTAVDEGRSKPSTTAQLYLLVPLSVSRTPPTAAVPRRAEVAPPPEEESSAAAVPLDMTRRGRLQRPSEEPPHHQHLLRPSVITCARRPSPAARDVAGVGADDDPDIDEHFRRSLGNAYQHLFSGNNNNNNGSRGKDPAAPTLSLQITGNSVDDHFAKALGDTWQRLQQRREESGDGDRQQWGRGDDHRATD